MTETLARRSILAGALGAAAGVVAALLFLAFMAPLVIEETVGSVLLDPSSQRFRPQFTPTAGAAYLLVSLAGAAIGAVIARIAIALAASTHPEEPRLSAAPVVLLAAGMGAALAYAALRIGVGVGGTIPPVEPGEIAVINLSVFRAIVIALSGGAALGGSVAVTAEWLSRPAVVGLENEAWPASTARFMRDALTAMGIPLMALATVALVAWGFSRLLLLEPGLFAVTVFSLGAAIVLGAAAFVAYMGGPKEE